MTARKILKEVYSLLWGSQNGMERFGSLLFAILVGAIIGLASSTEGFDVGSPLITGILAMTVTYSLLALSYRWSHNIYDAPEQH